MPRQLFRVPKRKIDAFEICNGQISFLVQKHWAQKKANGLKEKWEEIALMLVVGKHMPCKER